MRIKILLGFLAFFALIVGFNLIKKISFPKEKTRQEVLGEPVASPAENVIEIYLGGKLYKMAWYQVVESEKLFLLSNFQTQLSSKEAQAANNCSFLASGGFYSKDNQPTGLFISEGTLLKNFVPNKLLNGVFSVNYLATPRITSQQPRDDLRLAVQAGPLLIENSFLQKVSLTYDSEARRVVVATTGANEIYFLIFWNPDTFFGGPQLVDLPEGLKAAEKQIGVSFADALNLDGGAASAFSINNSTKLTEAKTIGSFFCVKD